MIGFLCIPMLILVIVAYTQAKSLRQAAARGACYGAVLGLLVGVKIGIDTGDPGEAVLWGALNAISSAVVVALFASLGWLITAALGGVKPARPSDVLKDLAARLPALNELADLVRTGRLFPAEEYAALDVHHALGERARPEWQAEWNRVLDEVTERKQGARLPDSLLSMIGHIRQDAFAQGIKATQDARLAECVANDLGLIALALALGYHDGWLNALWQCYQNGSFPHQTLTPVPGELTIAGPPETADYASRA